MKQLIIIWMFFPFSLMGQFYDSPISQDSAIELTSGKVLVRQGNDWLSVSDCGTWVKDTVYVSNWVPLDTLGIVLDEKREWVYDEEKFVSSPSVHAVYAPCGQGNPDAYEMYRICAITGIKELRVRTITYKYIPKPKTDYQKIIQKFKK